MLLPIQTYLEGSPSKALQIKKPLKALGERSNPASLLQGPSIIRSLVWSHIILIQLRHPLPQAYLKMVFVKNFALSGSGAGDRRPRTSVRARAASDPQSIHRCQLNYVRFLERTPSRASTTANSNSVRFLERTPLWRVFAEAKQTACRDPSSGNLQTARTDAGVDRALASSSPKRR